MMGRLSRAWDQPSAVLLVVQLGSVLLFPFMEGTPLGRAALSTVGLIILFLAVRAVRATPALGWIAVLLGLPLIGLTIWEVVDPLNGPVVFSSSVLHATFYFYTSVALVAYLFRDRFVTPDELWARLPRSRSSPGPSPTCSWPSRSSGRDRSRRPWSPTAQRTWFELLFLSFTNLTSVGLSDIAPVLPHARSWVMIEQVAGLLYVALVISRVVGLTITRQRGYDGRRRQRRSSRTNLSNDPVQACPEAIVSDRRPGSATIANRIVEPSSPSAGSGWTQIGCGSAPCRPGSR